MTSCIVDKPTIFGLTGSADLSSDSESDVYTKPTEPMAGDHEKTMLWTICQSTSLSSRRMIMNALRDFFCGN